MNKLDQFNIKALKVGFSGYNNIRLGDYHLDILQGFINPEYGAIKDIANFIK